MQKSAEAVDTRNQVVKLAGDWEEVIQLGSYLSGNPNCKTHGTTTHTLKIDSFKVGRDFLAGFNPTLWEWDNGASIFILWEHEKFKNRIRFIYSITNSRSGEEEKIRQMGGIVWKDSNNIGGKHAFFLCPTCGKQVQFVYLHENYFKCRECAKLNYPSQQVTPGLDEAIFKLMNAAKKLGVVGISPYELATSYGIKKPKHMHWKKYYKLYADYLKVLEEYTEQYRLSAKKFLK